MQSYYRNKNDQNGRRVATGAFDCDQNDGNGNNNNNGKGEALQTINDQFMPNEDSIEQHFNYNPLYTGLQLDHDHEYVDGHNNEDKSTDRLNSSKQHSNDVVHQHRLIENSDSGTINQAISLMQACDTQNVLEDLYSSYQHSSSDNTAANRNVRVQAGTGSNNRSGGTNNNSANNNKQHCQSLEYMNIQQQRRQQQQQQHSQNLDQRSKLRLTRACNQIQKEPNGNNDEHRLQQHYNQQEQQQQVVFPSLGAFNGNNNGQYDTVLGSQVGNNLQCQTDESARQQRQKIMIDKEQQQQDLVCDNIGLQQQQQQQGQKRFVDTGTTHISGMASNRVNMNTDSERFQAQGQQQQQQPQQQQQQYFVATGDNSEEPMFTEYQNNNRMALGISDDMHNMNHVISCDNETLEEQINMLSNEDFMSTSHGDQIDYHGFASNDQFLNMLFSGAGNTGNTGPQNNGTLANNSNLLTSNVQSTSAINKGGRSIVSPNQLQKQQESPAAVSAQHSQVSQDMKEGGSELKSRANQKIISSKDQTKKLSKTNKKKDKVSQPSQAGAETVSSDEGKGSSKYSKKSGSKRKISSSQQPSTNQPAATVLNNNNNNESEFKIATANTNKRLMPKKTTNAERNSYSNINNHLRRDAYANNSCLTSPTSTSNTSNSSVVSPNANQLDHENSYKLQLDNLRKKLKMDVVPVSSSQSMVDPSSSMLQTSSAVSLIATSASDHLTVDIQNQNQQQQDTGGGVYHPQHHIQHHHQVPIQVIVRDGNSNQNLVSTNCNIATIRSSQSNLVQNNNNTVIHKQSPMGSSNNSTYVIAKPIEGQTLDTNHGGTIYLSTSSGLVQVATTTQQQTGINSTNAYSVSGPIAPIPLNAPLILGCLGQRRNCKNAEIQGPTGLVYQQSTNQGSCQSPHTNVTRQINNEQINTNRTNSIGIAQQLIFSGDDHIKNNFPDGDSTGSHSNLIRNIQNSEPTDSLQHGINII